VKNCPVCGKEYPDNVKFCPVDGSTLRAKSPTADLVGQVIADRYHIIKKLGEGGMGAVYLGEHVKMGRKSAIKVMNPGMAADPDAISRFNREASNASRISHPNVCQIYDFGETPDGVIYLAMEFIEGSALTDIIEREGALPPVRAARMLKQAADALASAHDLGIVHRDLKPDNIMVVQGRDGADIVKVVDFGIAKAVAGDEAGQKVTKTGLVVGTPEYMSPEQLSGDKLDGRSDIYSLGLVFYRMLTGVLPFQADSAQETMIKRLTDEPMRLETARPDIVFPPAMQAVLDLALARLPSERYPSAAQFGRDAEAAVEGMEVPGTRVAEPVASAATQLMDSEAALKAIPTKKKTPPTAAAPAAAPPAKKFPLVPVLGGVGGVAAIAVVAVLALGGGKKSAAGPTGADSSRTGQQTAAAPNNPQPGPGNTQTASNNRTPSRPGPRQTTTTSQPPAPAPPTGGASPAAIEDSLNAAVRASQADQQNDARRLARWVFYRDGATAKEKADAAELVAASYDNDPATALEWYRQALPFAIGNQRTRIDNAIKTLQGNP
jgi:serine/threonine protein kinase